MVDDLLAPEVPGALAWTQSSYMSLSWSGLGTCLEGRPYCSEGCLWNAKIGCAGKARGRDDYSMYQSYSNKYSSLTTWLPYILCDTAGPMAHEPGEITKKCSLLASFHCSGRLECVALGWDTLTWVDHVLLAIEFDFFHIFHRRHQIVVVGI